MIGSKQVIHFLLGFCLLTGCASAANAGAPGPQQVAATLAPTAAPTARPATPTPVPTATSTATPTVVPSPTVEVVPPVIDILRDSIGPYDLLLPRADARYQNVEVVQYENGSLAEAPLYTLHFDIQAMLRANWRPIRPDDPSLPVYVMDTRIPSRQTNYTSLVPVYHMPVLGNEIAFVPIEAFAPYDLDTAACPPPIACSRTDAKKIVLAIWLLNQSTSSLVYHPGGKGWARFISLAGVSTGRVAPIPGTVDQFAVETMLYDDRRQELYVVWLPAPYYTLDESLQFRKAPAAETLRQFKDKVRLVIGAGQILLDGNQQPRYDCQKEASAGDPEFVQRCLAIAAQNGADNDAHFRAFFLGEPVPGTFLVNGLELRDDLTFEFELAKLFYDPRKLVEQVTITIAP